MLTVELNSVTTENDAPQCVSSGASAQHKGFTLLETTIALLLLMIVSLGSMSLFSFSIYNNSAAGDRATCLAIAQEALETLRTAQFDPSATSSLLAGGTTTQTNIARSGRLFTLTKTIDDNPATAAVDVNTTSTLKRITVTVTSQRSTQGWTAAGSVTLMTQRTQAE